MNTAQVVITARDDFDARNGIRNDGQVFLGAINLEGLDIEDLFIASNHPALHRDVRSAANLLVLARELRCKGRIQEASKLEGRVDALYHIMPKSCRW